MLRALCSLQGTTIQFLVLNYHVAVTNSHIQREFLLLRNLSLLADENKIKNIKAYIIFFFLFFLIFFENYFMDTSI